MKKAAYKVLWVILQACAVIAVIPVAIAFVAFWAFIFFGSRIAGFIVKLLPPTRRNGSIA